ADREPAERFDVPDATVDHEAAPAVLEREPGDVVADEGAAQRTAAVDDEHAPVPRLGHALLHEHVVLEAADGRDLAREGRDTAELAQLKLADDRAVCVRVPEIRRRRHASSKNPCSKSSRTAWTVSWRNSEASRLPRSKRRAVRSIAWSSVLSP